LSDHAGIFGAIAGAVYQLAMNKADTRMWTSLPKDFDVARVPSGGTITVTGDGKKLAEVETDPSKNYMIFVRLINKKSPPIVSYRAF
jgi:hypothetical protein